MMPLQVSCGSGRDKYLRRIQSGTPSTIHDGAVRMKNVGVMLVCSYPTVSTIATMLGLCRSLEHNKTCGYPRGCIAWASCRIRKIAGCACAGNAGNVFPTTAGLRSRHATRHVRHARAVMHARIAN